MFSTLPACWRQQAHRRQGAVFLLFGIAVALAGCDPSPQPPPVEAVQPVLVEPVVTRQGSPLTYSGDSRTRYESELAFRVPSKIVSRSVDTGDAVASGQVLGRLDAADLRLNAQAARAQLVATESDFRRMGSDCRIERAPFSAYRVDSNSEDPGDGAVVAECLFRANGSFDHGWIAGSDVVNFTVSTGLLCGLVSSAA